MTYTLNINTDYLRTTLSTSPERGQDPQRGKCNNFDDRKNAGRPIWFVEHFTAGALQPSLNAFINGAASAHYMIDKDGTVYKLVDDQYRAYHAGVGALKSGSKLQHFISDAILRGKDENGVLGNGPGDMNSWSIGIEHVNSGFEPYTPEQIKASIYLHEKLAIEHNIDTKYLINHGEWALGRKIDAGPYFPWQEFANASKIYPDIKHNFGVYSAVALKENPEVIISSTTQNQLEIRRIQEKLQELGYKVIKDNESNWGIYDKNTRDAIFAFNIHYMNESIISDPSKLESWNLVTNSNPAVQERARNALALWTENNEVVMTDILTQYTENGSSQFN